MTKSREKKVILSGVTSEQMEQAFSDYAIADAKIQHITSKMDVEITKIREKYQDELQSWGEEKEKTFDILQSFATEKRDELFSKKKSMDTVHGIFGFRTGTPKLKTLKGFTWGAVTILLKEYLPGYVRTTEEPAKDKLLADREVPELLKLFPNVGIYVDQDETFFVEPKKEEVI